MPTLPTYRDLGPLPSARTGRVVSAPDLTAVGRGLASMGASIADAGQAIGGAIASKTTDVSQAERFEAQRRFLEFSAAQDDALTQAGQTAQPGAFGFREGFQQSYQKAAKEFFSTIPEALKPEYDVKLFQAEDSLAGRALTFERTQRKDYYTNTVNDGLLKIENKLYENPGAFDENLKEGNAFIDSIPDEDVSPIAKEDMRRQWKTKAQVASLNGMPPKARMEALGAPPAAVAPLPADVQGRASMARDHFVKLGYTPEQAAGIVGNLVQESGVRSDGPAGDQGTAFGMAQWRGERLTRLKRFANAQGRDWRDFTTQLNFIDMELKNHETGAYQALKAAKTVDEATAAFIGYERPKGWSTSNPRGGHGWGNRLAAAQRTAGVEVTATRGEVAPQYADMSWEEREKIVHHAVGEQQSTERAEMAMAAAQRTATKEALDLGIVDGSVVSELEIMEAPIDDGDKATLIRALRTRDKAVIQIQKDLQALQNGALTLDPYASDDKNRADNLYNETMKQAGVESAVAVAGAVLEQTGVVPQPVINTMRRGLSGTDVGEFVTAAQTAQRVSSINPAALARRDGGTEVQKIADDFGFMVNALNLDPEEAAKRLIERNKPEKQFERKALEPAAKEFIKQIQNEDLAAQFDDSVFGWRSDPDIGFSPAQEFGIKAEYLAIAEDQFYAVGGDPELAKNRAIEEMKRLYGVSDVTGRKVIMKHPPERYWPALRVQEYGKTSVIGDSPSLDYARIQLRNDLTAIEPNIDMGSVQMVTTPETDRMVKRGEMPGYAVLYKDANGVLQTIPGKLWRPDPAADIERQSVVEETEKTKRIESARQYQESVRRMSETGGMREFMMQDESQDDTENLGPRLPDDFDFENQGVP